MIQVKAMKVMLKIVGIGHIYPETFFHAYNLVTAVLTIMQQHFDVSFQAVIVAQNWRKRFWRRTWEME